MLKVVIQKNLPVKRDFAADGYLSEAQNPYPLLYTYSHRERGGGKGVELNQREG